jgi:hypothetical protein
LRKYLVRIAATLAIAGSLVGLGGVGVAHAESYTLVLRGVTAVTCYNAGDAGVRAGFYRQYFCNQQGYNSYRLYVIYA